MATVNLCMKRVEMGIPRHILSSAKPLASALKLFQKFQHKIIRLGRFKLDFGLAFVILVHVRKSLTIILKFWSEIGSGYLQEVNN